MEKVPNIIKIVLSPYLFEIMTSYFKNIIYIILLLYIPRTGNFKIFEKFSLHFDRSYQKDFPHIFTTWSIKVYKHTVQKAKHFRKSDTYIALVPPMHLIDTLLVDLS